MPLDATRRKLENRRHIENFVLLTVNTWTEAIIECVVEEKLFGIGRWCMDWRQSIILGYDLFIDLIINTHVDAVSVGLFFAGTDKTKT